MARPRKSKELSKQGPPIAFRAGPDLTRLVESLVAEWKISIAEAFKNLAALAAVGLDVRYYDLVAGLAGALGGVSPFVRAALQIHVTLLTATRIEPRYAFDPERTWFVIDTVREQITAGGMDRQTDAIRSLVARLGIQPPSTPAVVNPAPITPEQSTDGSTYSEPVDRSKRKPKKVRKIKIEE